MSARDFASVGFRTLGTGMGFTEGPVFSRDRSLIVTSIDRGHVYVADDNVPRLFAVTGGGANGATEGEDGVIFVAQNGGRGPGWRRPAMPGGIQAIRTDARVDWVTQDPIAPNDLCFGPDGLLYVTDPTRGDVWDDGRLWRVDVTTGDAELLRSVNWYPNGIAFGHEDDAVYVVSTTHRQILRFPVSDQGLGEAALVIQLEHGRPDGFAFDAEGNFIVACNGDERTSADVQVFDGKGNLLEVIRLGDYRYCTNVALTPDRRLAATIPDLGAVTISDDWPTPGLPLHPFRESIVEPGRQAAARGI